MFSGRKALYQFTVLLVAIAFALSGSAVASGKDKSKKKADETQQQTSSTKVDLNTASDKELDSLPGVGSATVKKIVAGRPYSSVDDLKRAGVSQSQIENIRNLVTVSSLGAASETSSASPGAASTKPSPSRSPEPSTLPQSDNPSAAPPSGSGMVWANLDTKIYHREGDRWYGKTKHGKYMSEADAQKAGYRAAKTGKGKE